MADAVRTMHARDAVSAKLASCYITIDGERYLLMQAKNLEARVEKNKVEVPILGKTGLGHRATNWNGTGSMTVYGNTSKFAELVNGIKIPAKIFILIFRCATKTRLLPSARRPLF